MGGAAATPEIADSDAFARAFHVSRETIDKLSTYEALLRQWQRTINLVAPSTLDTVWSRHFANSAQLLAHAPADAKQFLDVGSGAGFPGLVLAVMLADRPGAKVTLIESDTRKAAFLAEVARKTGAPVDIRPERIEKAATQSKLGAVDVITARALAPLPRLFELTAPAFSAHTTGLFLKGRDVQSELDAAGERWTFEATLRPSLTDAGGRIVVIRALEAKGPEARTGDQPR